MTIKKRMTGADHTIQYKCEFWFLEQAFFLTKQVILFMYYITNRSYL